MQKKIIQRFGTNDLGANPNWIIKTRLIDKNEIVPNDWEAVTNTELKTQLNNQREAFNTWKASQPIPERNFNLKQEQLAIKVTNKPSISYRIYKYLSSDIIDTRSIDVTQPPHSVVYDKQLSVKVYEDYVIEKGLKKSVIVNVINLDGTIGEELLKGEMSDYVFDIDGPMPSSLSLLSRITKRQWILEDGTYRDDDLDVKTSPKIYKTSFEKNVEGQKRRNSIFNEVVKVYGTLLTIYKTNGDVAGAENIGKQLLSEIGSEVTNYITTGSNVILKDIEDLTKNTVILDDYGLNINVTANFNINQTYPETIGMTVSEAIQEKFKGVI